MDRRSMSTTLLPTSTLTPANAKPRSRAITLRAVDSIPSCDFRDLRRSLVLDHCKWDPQVEDVSTIVPFPLLMPRDAWKDLKIIAEKLAAETIAIERALIERPRLIARLGLPRKLRTLFENASTDDLSPAAARVMRFDFHPTDEGWALSEVNSDVPGGYAEASALPKAMAAHFAGYSTTGDPAAAYVDALARITTRGPIVLLSAAGFMEDHQVVAHLANRLRERGIAATLAQPQHLKWRDGVASLDSAWYRGDVTAIVRFFQCEWLTHQPRSVNWRPFIVGGRTPIANPGVSSLSESKRLPLAWDDLNCDTSAWKTHLPETREPRHVDWQHDESWILKTAYCNTGDSVSHRALLPAKDWRRTVWDIRLRPNQWLAQRRFESRPIETPIGEMHACLGVYTIDGRACGIYGRLSPKPVIRYDAVDVAVLVEAEEATA